MLGGIVFQMGMYCISLNTVSVWRASYQACITIYVFLAAEFFLRFIHDKPLGGLASSHKGEVPTVLLDKPMQIMIGGLIFNTTCLFIRYASAPVVLLLQTKKKCLRVVLCIVRSSCPTDGMGELFQHSFTSVHMALLELIVHFPTAF